MKGFAHAKTSLAICSSRGWLDDKEKGSVPELSSNRVSSLLKKVSEFLTKSLSEYKLQPDIEILFENTRGLNSKFDSKRLVSVLASLALLYAGSTTAQFFPSRLTNALRYTSIMLFSVQSGR